MAKRNSEIKTVSYIHYNGQLVPLDELPPEVKHQAAAKIKITYLNELFRGKAFFEEVPDHADV